MPASPSTANYRIGKGIVSFKATGAGSYADLGNCPVFTYTPAITKKDHFSSRQGIKTKDLTRITELGATIKMTLDEITGENLALFALSDLDSDTAGDIVLRGLSKTTFTGSIKVVGTNDVGQLVDFIADVSFVPAGDFSFITDGDDYSLIQVEADVLVDNAGNYGVWTIRENS